MTRLVSGRTGTSQEAPRADRICRPAVDWSEISGNIHPGGPAACRHDPISSATRSIFWWVRPAMVVRIPACAKDAVAPLLIDISFRSGVLCDTVVEGPVLLLGLDETNEDVLRPLRLSGGYAAPPRRRIIVCARSFKRARSAPNVDHHFSTHGRSTTSNAQVDRCWRCSWR